MLEDGLQLDVRAAQASLDDAAPVVERHRPAGEGSLEGHPGEALRAEDALAGVTHDAQLAVDGFRQPRDLEADLVLLAMGFVSPVRDGLLRSLGVELDTRGNVLATTEDYQTKVPAVFAAGDMRRGQSLVVWAIREGRQCARAVDEFLMGSSDLPAPD